MNKIEIDLSKLSIGTIMIIGEEYGIKRDIRETYRDYADRIIEEIRSGKSFKRDDFIGVSDFQCRFTLLDNYIKNKNELKNKNIILLNKDGKYQIIKNEMVIGEYRDEVVKFYDKPMELNLECFIDLQG